MHGPTSFGVVRRSSTISISLFFLPLIVADTTRQATRRVYPSRWINLLTTTLSRLKRKTERIICPPPQPPSVVRRQDGGALFAHHHPSSTPSFARNARRRGSFVHLSVSTQEEGQTSSPFVHYVSTHGGGVTPPTPFVHLRFDASGGSIRPLSEQRVRFDARRNATSSPLFTSVSTPGGGISLPISLCSPPFRRQ